MAIIIHCPSCNVRLTLDDERAGTRFPCGRCGKDVVAPGAARPAAPPPAPRSAVAPARPARPAPYRAPVAADEPAGGGWADKRVAVGVVAACGVLLVAGVVGATFALRKPAAVAEQAAGPAPATPTPPAGVVPVPPPAPTTPPAPTPPVVPPAPPAPQRKCEFVEVTVSQVKQRMLKLGVNGTGSDDVGAILTSLGKGYPFTLLTPADVESENRLAEFDVVFLNCGGPVGDPRRAVTALRQFVAGGKTLYASDLQYALMSQTFPDVVDAKSRFAGTSGVYKAEVLDEGLREQLGPTVDLNFNAGGWQAAAFAGPDAVTVLRAADNDFRLRKGTPLLVKFAQGNGQVIFTSFHNSGIAGDTARKLLRYLVFSAVLAESNARVRRALVRDGFTAKTSDVLNAAESGWEVTKTLGVPTGGTFRVGVGFNTEGADVDLVLEGPGGLRFTRTSPEAFVGEVCDAPAGEWKLTLTARRIPYPNFPLTLFTTDAKPE